MVENEPAGAGTTEPKNDPSDLAGGQAFPPAAAENSSVPLSQALPPTGPLPPQGGLGPQPGTLPPPYLPPGYPPQGSGWPPQPGFASFGYPPPSAGYGPPLYQPQPGFGPHAYPASGPAPGLRWGGVGARFVALFIDLFIVVGIWLVVSFVVIWAAALNAQSGYSSGYYSDNFGNAIPILLTWLACGLFALIYHPTCWYLFEGTPGQRAVDLRVVRASDGQSLGVGAVLARYLTFCIFTVLFPLGIIAGFIAANDPFKRAWHDQLTGSVVVQRL